MNPTLHAARIDGATEAFLSLHTSREGAVAALLAEGGRLYRERFDYVPPELTTRTTNSLREFASTLDHVVTKAEDRLLGGGWNARVEQVEVHLDDDRELPFGRQYARP